MKTVFILLISLLTVFGQTRVTDYRASSIPPSDSDKGNPGEMWIVWSGPPQIFVKTNGVDQIGWSLVSGSGGGGGDTIWTNNAGTIEATQPIANEADGTPIFLIDSSLLHTSGDLFEVLNLGSQRLTLDKNGFLQVFASNAGHIELFPQTGDAAGYASDTFSFWDLTADNDDVEFRIGKNGDIFLSMLPFVADGTIPYTFDTSVAHTTGNLLTVGNMGTTLMDLQATGVLDVNSSPASHAGVNFNVTLTNAFSGQGIELAVSGVGFTGVDVEGFAVENFVAVTNATKIIYFNSGLFGAELATFSDGDYTGQALGAIGIAEGGSSTQIGLAGYAQARNDNQINVGVVGTASLDPIGGGSLSGTIGTGGYFEVLTSGNSNSDPSYTNVVLQLNNRDSAVPFLIAGNNDGPLIKLDSDGSITTGVPTTATNALPFKVGQVANTATVTLVATNYLQIEVGGVLYKLGLVK